jgi:antitoxin component of RelBE/YafQ-DinJ toxin-antitoxin module
VGGEEKPVAHLGVCLRGKIIGLVVEVLIRLGANNVASTHRIPVALRRSSSRRCLSSQ